LPSTLRPRCSVRSTGADPVGYSADTFSLSSWRGPTAPFSVIDPHRMAQTCGLTDGFVRTGIIALTYGQVGVNATRCRRVRSRSRSAALSRSKVPSMRHFLASNLLCNEFTAGCTDTDLPAGRSNFGQSDDPLVELAHMYHAIWVTFSETRCRSAVRVRSSAL